MTQLNRKGRAQLAQQTLSILAEGQYLRSDGVTNDIREPLRVAQEGTESWPPDRSPPSPITGRLDTRFTVENCTTLEAAQRLAEAAAPGEPAPVALNFASAKNPGGGFLNGSLAQEESLAMCSGLYACVQGDEMYTFHRGRRDPMYTDYALYSPAVPVFRTDDGALLDQPYTCAMITAPAVNAGVASARGATAAEIEATMVRRIAKVLAIAAHYGHEDIVLGAWGCGVFRNDPEMISRLFAEALRGSFAGVFRHVYFAVLSRDGRIVEPFQRHFA